MAPDAQFQDCIEVTIEPDWAFKLSRPKKLNQFGITEKKLYRTEDVAKVLGVSTDLVRWRFRTGRYSEVNKDSAGRRIFSIRDIQRLAAIPMRRIAPAGSNNRPQKG